jgi:YggT family protein
MLELLAFISKLIDLYIFVIFFSVILSWLIAFGVVNSHNPFVRSLGQALSAVTEPLLGRIRRSMPDLGALDISPLVLIIFCWFVQGVVLPNIAKLVV